MSLLFTVTIIRANVAIAADAIPTMGILRVDNSAVVVAAGTAMTPGSGNSYSMAVPDNLLVAGKTYRGTYVGTWAGQVVTNYFDKTAAMPATADSYLSVGEADQLAANLLNVAAYTAASSTNKAAALAMASERLDTAMRYQGSKFAASQVREFPRLAYGTSRMYGALVHAADPNAGSLGSDVWDLDATGLTAVVPDRVKRACVLEANSLLAGDRKSALNAQHDGLAAQAIGSASESYNTSAVQQVLCRPAFELMKHYRLRSGPLL